MVRSSFGGHPVVLDLMGFNRHAGVTQVTALRVAAGRHIRIGMSCESGQLLARTGETAPFGAFLR